MKKVASYKDEVHLRSLQRIKIGKRLGKVSVWWKENGKKNGIRAFFLIVKKQ